MVRAKAIEATVEAVALVLIEVAALVLIEVAEVVAVVRWK
jgi:hypothetical protein